MRPWSDERVEGPRSSGLAVSGSVRPARPSDVTPAILVSVPRGYRNATTSETGVCTPSGTCGYRALPIPAGVTTTRGWEDARVVRHATDAALDELEPLLDQLRGIEGLIEKKRGVFYRRSRAFLHFHEDPSGLYADVRLEGIDFERFRVETREERRELLRLLTASLS